MKNYLTINDTDYELNFGMGFIRKIDKTVQVPIEGLPGQKQNAGLQMAISYVIDHNLEEIEKMLIIANEGKSPKLTTSILDAYLEDEGTDVIEFCDKVLDFLRLSNCTSEKTKLLEEAVAKTQEEKK